QWVVLDGDTPALNKLTVVGVLEIPDTADDADADRDANATADGARRPARALPEYRSVVIDATYISIQGGKLIAGWSDEPFRGQLHIKLRGDHRTPDWPLPEGPNQGSKVLGVFGTLELYGLAPSVYHTKLADTAAAGTDTLPLDQAVDWKMGDEVVISTTGFNAWETETRRNHTLVAGNHSVPGTARTYTLSADVGLLTRNIKIEGQDYPELFQESFGARVLVGTYSWAGIDYKGVAQIRNVEFHHSGQEGWSDYTDPRYSVAFLNLGQVAANESYLQGCAFHHGFSPAIGVFGTDGLIWGNRVTVRRNLVTLTRWPGSYQDREEGFNYNWNAGIEVNEGTKVVLQHNIVAGFERVGYRIDGEPCPGSQSSEERWHQNEAHGGLYGVYMNKDGLPGCSLIRGFTVWKSYDYGIYFQTPSNVIVAEVTLADNGLGLMPLVYWPPSLSHAYADKTIQVRSYKCFGLNYRLLAIESMDADTETRRLSPVAILGNGFVDLINGPQDHGWCAGYTCQLRLSLFHSIVATGHAFDVYFTSVTPQKLRLMMLNAPPTESVLVSIFYSKPQRLDVYVDNSLVGPTNAEWNAENTDYIMKEPTHP
ncbi:hypothetical protein CRUP_021887, partial [Coryphaenoides rupestris]